MSSRLSHIAHEQLERSFAVQLRSSARSSLRSIVRRTSSGRSEQRAHSRCHRSFNRRRLPGRMPRHTVAESVAPLVGASYRWAQNATISRRTVPRAEHLRQPTCAPSRQNHLRTGRQRSSGSAGGRRDDEGRGVKTAEGHGHDRWRPHRPRQPRGRRQRDRERERERETHRLFGRANRLWGGSPHRARARLAEEGEGCVWWEAPSSPLGGWWAGGVSGGVAGGGWVGGWAIDRVLRI